MIKIEEKIKEIRNQQYNKLARKYPAYICLVIPIILGISMGIDDCIESNIWWKAIIYIMSISTISTAIFFLFGLFVRDIAKIYPEKIIFSDCLKPTNRMLYSTDSTYSEEQKMEIRKKIKLKKSIDLFKYKNKTYKNKKYVKRLDEAVVWLLDVTRFDDILFEYNCIYGFWRNLTAALLVDALLVFILSAINKWYYALPIGSVLVWIAILVILLSLFTTMIAYKNGYIFAKKVYDVFMNLDENMSNY